MYDAILTRHNGHLEADGGYTISRIQGPTFWESRPDTARTRR